MVVVIEDMTEFTIYPRSDCSDKHPERFAIVAPNGCALPLKPLTIGQANSIAGMLNAFVNEEDLE